MCLPEKETQANGRTRRCAPTGNNNHPQCRGRPMCLPEYASKRKKYSSTASGPTGSPSVMIEGVRRSREGVPKRRSLKEKKRRQMGAQHRCAPTAIPIKGTITINPGKTGIYWLFMGKQGAP